MHLDKGIAHRMPFSDEGYAGQTGKRICTMLLGREKSLGDIDHNILCEALGRMSIVTHLIEVLKDCHKQHMFYTKEHLGTSEKTESGRRPPGLCHVATLSLLTTQLAAQACLCDGEALLDLSRSVPVDGSTPFPKL